MFVFNSGKSGSQHIGKILPPTDHSFPRGPSRLFYSEAQEETELLFSRSGTECLPGYYRLYFLEAQEETELLFSRSGTECQPGLHREICFQNNLGFSLTFLARCSS